MNIRRNIYLIIFLLCIASQQGFSQFSQLSGVVNKYTSIETIYCINTEDVDSVKVASVDDFDIGDTVMVYCVQGAEIITDTSLAWPEFEDIGSDARNPGNTGRYAFLIINKIDVPGRVVVFNNKVTPGISTLEEGEVAQLIRVPSYRNAEVTSSGVFAREWNGVTGGVVTLFAGVLKLSGDINVTGTGFRGAEGSTDDEYLGACSSVDPDLSDSLFYHIDNIWAGKKGEGTTDTTFNRLRGKAKNINGGGGGNGLFSGGGGGSNYNFGGSGGNESSSCPTGIALLGGQGGFDLKAASYYANYLNDVPIGYNRYDRIFFGGGGGAGTWQPGWVNTNGGNGGGLVVIVADSIIGNDKWIIADGIDVADIATGAAGGGGGGGCIILDVNGYKTNLNLSAVGGDGGNTADPDTTGPGGGGGGGIYWLAGSEHPGVMKSPDKGNHGKYLSTVIHGASDGGRPGEKDDLVTPIRGFIFNPVPTEFVVCSNILPDPIFASEPKGGGGSGTFDYLWVDSSSTQNEWLPAPQNPPLTYNNQQNYNFPDKLSDTTYFRRVVFDKAGILPADTSFRIAVYVHPAITDNTIAAPDTVCAGNAPQLFEPSAIIGGGPTGGTYTYKWQKDEGGGLGPAVGDTTDLTYQAPGLNTTTDFARIAYAGVCVDTSNLLRVEVLVPHDAFQITPSDTVCYNTEEPEPLASLSGLPPLNGDPNSMRYQWLTSTDTVNWTRIGGATLESYQPPLQTETVYYSRMVLSGIDSACIDTSDYVEILNIDLIDNNTITETQTLCFGDEATPLNGSTPVGGVPDTYSYLWESRTRTSDWSELTVWENDNNPYEPGKMEGDSTMYRRRVGSGRVARDVCISYSDTVFVHVHPAITDNTVSASDTICEGDTPAQFDPAAIIGGGPAGGVFTYRWVKDEGAGYVDADGEIIDPDYQAPELIISTDYARIAYTGECVDTSNALIIKVDAAIGENSIDNFMKICYNDSKNLRGSEPTGEPGIDPVYTWRTWPDGQDSTSGVDILESDEQEFFSGPYDSFGDFHYDRVVKIGACYDSTNSMTVTVMQLPGGELTDADFWACEIDTALLIDLDVDVSTPFDPTWHVFLKNGAESGIVTDPILNPQQDRIDTLDIVLDINNDNTQLYYEIESIQYYPEGDEYACVSPAERITGSGVQVDVFRTPEPQIIADEMVGESYEVCGPTAPLSANADNGQGLWFSEPADVIFSPDPSVNSVEAYLSELNNSAAYLLTFESVLGVCTGIDSLQITYFEQPEDAYAGGDTMVFLKNSFQLNANPPTAGSGEWTLETGNGIFENDTLHNTWVYDLAIGEQNEFRWEVSNGINEGTCASVSDIAIVIQNEIRRYNGFSPNGDMDNEYFIMRGMRYADEFEINFFNSLGKTVRTITHENVGELRIDESLIRNNLQEDERVVWDGYSKNDNLVPSGTYYYVVNLKIKYKDGEGIETGKEDSYEYKDYVVVVRE